MSYPGHKFAFTKKGISLPGGVVVRKDSVGVLESQSERKSSIFFIAIWRRIEVDNEDLEVFDVKKTGDGFPKKICNICHRLLNTSEFAKNQNGINNRSVRRPSCGECRKLLEGVSPTLQAKREWLKKKPNNIPFECPVCGKRTIAGVTSKVVLDHNHITGKPRAWICDSCNTGIGRFKDDKTILRNVIRYLG